MDIEKVKAKIRRNLPAKPFELRWKATADRNKIISDSGNFWIIRTGEEFQVWGKFPNREVLLHDRVKTSEEAKRLASSHAASAETEAERAINKHPLQQSAHARIAEGPK